MASRLKTQSKDTPKPDIPQTTAENVAIYQALMPLLTAMFGEFKELSKKKPEGALNKRKIAIVNRLLKNVMLILEEEPSRPYLDLLDEDDVPQNSDVLLILSQFDAAMNAYRIRYYYTDTEDDFIPIWHTE